MTGNHADFARQLAALAERLARVSTELAAAGRGLIERRLLPPEALADELAGIVTDFEDLRARVLAAAAALSLGPTPPVTTVRELEVLLRVVTETESRRARRAEDAQKPPAVEDVRRHAEQEARRAQEPARPKAEDAKRQAAEDARKRAAEAEERARQMEQERREAEVAARRQAEERAQEARRRAEEEAKRQAEEQARRRAEEEARRRADEEEERRRRDQDARRRAEEDARVPTPAEAAAEAEEADLGLETAQWWISANASWTSIKSRQISFAEAVHDVLVKYPYVFSVPIQTSADYEDGLLAYGYAVLLDYVEQRSAGFVSEALNRLPARKGTSLGRRLYDYLAEPLRPAFGEFIRTVMTAALPKTALWVTGGIEESEQATTVFVRPSGRVGDPTQKAERFTQEPRRFVDHQFTTPVAPLTARFFRVEATEVKEPRTVEVRLNENGAASDHAWIVMTSTRNPTQSRRHDRKGTTVSGVGRDYSGVWVGLFNADAEVERRFDLTIGLKRRAASAAFQKK